MEACVRLFPSSREPTRRQTLASPSPLADRSLPLTYLKIFRLAFTRFSLQRLSIFFASYSLFLSGPSIFSRIFSNIENILTSRRSTETKSRSKPAQNLPNLKISVGIDPKPTVEGGIAVSSSLVKTVLDAAQRQRQEYSRISLDSRSTKVKREAQITVRVVISCSFSKISLSKVKGCGKLVLGRLHAKGYTLAHHLLSGSPRRSAHGGGTPGPGESAVTRLSA